MNKARVAHTTRTKTAQYDNLISILDQLIHDVDEYGDCTNEDEAKLILKAGKQRANQLLAILSALAS